MTSLSKARRSSDQLKLNFQHSLVARIECLQTGLYVVTLSTRAVIQNLHSYLDSHLSSLFANSHKLLRSILTSFTETSVIRFVHQCIMIYWEKPVSGHFNDVSILPK